MYSRNPWELNLLNNAYKLMKALLKNASQQAEENEWLEAKVLTSENGTVHVLRS